MLIIEFKLYNEGYKGYTLVEKEYPNWDENTDEDLIWAETKRIREEDYKDSEKKPSDFNWYDTEISEKFFAKFADRIKFLLTENHEYVAEGVFQEDLSKAIKVATLLRSGRLQIVRK